MLRSLLIHDIHSHRVIFGSRGGDGWMKVRVCIDDEKPVWVGVSFCLLPLIIFVTIIISIINGRVHLLIVIIIIAISNNRYIISTSIMAAMAIVTARDTDASITILLSWPPCACNSTATIISGRCMSPLRCVAQHQRRGTGTMVTRTMLLAVYRCYHSIIIYVDWVVQPL